jgi:hypothetical protein
MSINKTITPNDPADFTPTLGNYRTLQPFRYWCQKVLPLVYDDSLSYYELLCKVVDYLNKSMEDVETLHGDVTNIHKAYVELQNYVNNYFSTLDVQEEINNKLDGMASDGSLSILLKAIIGNNSLPTFVNSTSDMTNTLLVYVLNSNGHIYYYDSGNWKDSGLVYGSFNSYTPSDIIILKSNIDSYFNDLNNAPLNKSIYLYNITSDIMKNLPISPALGCLSTFQYSPRSNQPGGYQLFVSENRVFTRSNTGSAPNFNWGKWIEISNETTYHPSDILISVGNINSYFNDLNNAPLNRTIFLLNLTDDMMKNLPISPASGCLSTFQYSPRSNQPGGYQLFVCRNRAFTRINSGSAPDFTWSNWIEISSESSYRASDIIIIPSTIGDYFDNLNNAPLNKTIYLYKITDDIMKNLPISPATGCLSTFQYSDRSNQPGGYQLFVSENRVFTRSNTGSAPNFNWGNWIELSNPKEEKSYYPKGFNLFRKFCSVGDSLSVGYHTLKDGTPVSEDKDISWSSFIKNKYNNEVYWSGKSGATCLSWLNETSEEWGLKYAKKIGQMPLYILCMGANEVNQTIGSESDIGTTNNTLYSYVSRVIEELKKISPNCFIISTGISRGVGFGSSTINVNAVYKNMEKHYDNYYYMDCINEFNSLPFTTLYNNYHYTPIGYNSMAELFSDKLDEIIKKHLSEFIYA